MALESGTYLNDLVITNPPGSDDKNQGDDHIRLIKTTLKSTFPAMAGAAWRVQAKSANYTVVANDNMSVIRCTAAVTISLTAAATIGNQFMVTIIASSGVVTVDPNAAETLDGETALTLGIDHSVTMVCDGTNWFSIARSPEPAFAGYLTANQTGVVTATNTKLTIDTEDFDTHGYFDPTTNYRFTPLIAGKYLFIGSVLTGSMLDEKDVRLRLFKNGTNFKDGPLNRSAVAAGASVGASISVSVDANGTTDYFELYVIHNHGSNLTMVATDKNTYFAGVRIS